jgi:hypothetical protein
LEHPDRPIAKPSSGSLKGLCFGPVPEYLVEVVVDTLTATHPIRISKNINLHKRGKKLANKRMSEPTWEAAVPTSEGMSPPYRRSQPSFFTTYHSRGGKIRDHGQH